MQSVEQEGRWLADFPHESTVRFLAALAYELTIVARNSYRTQGCSTSSRLHAGCLLL